MPRREGTSSDAKSWRSSGFVVPAVSLLRALANADRLLLVCSLDHEERCVSDLAVETGIRQPTLSQQLGVLREQGLVTTRREGKKIFYRLSNPEASKFLVVLRKLYPPVPGRV